MTEQTTTTTAPDAPESNGAGTTEAPLCGHLVNTEKGSKPCVKPQGHDTEGTPAFEEFGKGHASRIQKRKEYAPIPKAALSSFKAVDEKEIVEYGATGAQAPERDEVQQEIDGHVKDVYQEWVAAGKPENFNDSPRKRYQFNPELEESFRAALRSAGRLHGVSVRIAPSKKLQNGKVALYWTAQDVRERDTKQTKDDIIANQTKAIEEMAGVITDVANVMGLNTSEMKLTEIMHAIVNRLHPEEAEQPAEAEQVSA